MAERPILLCHFDQADEHIVWPQAGTLAQQLRDAQVQRLLLLQRARVVGRDLDEDQVIAARHAHVGGVVAEVGGIVLGDDHELVILGHVEGLAQGLVQAVAKGLAVGLGFAGAHGDVEQGHVGQLCEW